MWALPQHRRVPLFFVVTDAKGRPSGVTADLGEALARRLGVPVEMVVATSSGDLVNATSAGEIDVSFIPVDEERKKKLDFGTSYFIMESTYLVRPDSDIITLAHVDRPHIRVIGIANTATIRSAKASTRC